MNPTLKYGVFAAAVVYLVTQPASAFFYSPVPAAKTPTLQSPVSVQTTSGRFSFKASTPLATVRFKAKRFDPNAQMFGDTDFYTDVEARCPKVINGTPYNWLPPVIHKLDPYHYATRATAEEIATALGGDVVEAEIIQYPCTVNRPQLEVRFKDEYNRDVRLNAGLVARTFNNNNEWAALLRVRSEIAHGFYQRVPSWDETANELNCGRSVLGIFLEPNPELAGECRR